MTADESDEPANAGEESAGDAEPEHEGTESAPTSGEPDAETPYATERTTAPQSPYTARDVAVGAAIAAVGIALTFVVPFILA